MMARPRKDESIPSGDARMVTAFWKQLAKGSYKSITVASIVREAGLNRATFYYYFDSIDDLARRAVATSIPVNLIDLVEGFLTGAHASLQLDSATRESIARLSLVAGDASANVLIMQFKQVLQEIWIRRFHVDVSRSDVQAIITFMASGVSGILGAWIRKPIDEKFDAYLQSISQVFSKSVLEFVATYKSAE
ncbi:TetR/AcrR family transcriptional regulator [Arcanobacterium hippocoleae]|uniref:AcrR family transcriptional regulator n=1 Tax=Arcanobacterium hippocoleae TaxID=149017 RepID=A0ABU1T1H6_9ACTO|nr:TetR/AcrR family transcriptional regulator [Arcanobacterium hippocoleae]MDR6938701.1 AcrR family transcriptional regulator [Arcanobacterium hippocoleae]